MEARFIIVLTFLLLFVPNSTLLSQDTFSIIAADPETGEIGAAGATCVDGIAQWGGIKVLNKVIPGRGGVNAQAWICLNPHINLDNAIEQMEAGLEPDEIITWLLQNDACNAQNFDPAYRQYGVVDFDEFGNIRTAAFTGDSADDWKGHITGDNYAIQGNILIGEELLNEMEAGFINTDGNLADKLMAAMQGANIPGADSRCLERGTSSTSAFLSVYTLDDLLDAPSTLLDVMEVPFGEEPIDSLQVLFDLEFPPASGIAQSDVVNIQLYPNPTEEELTIKLLQAKEPLQIILRSLDGKLIQLNSRNTGAQEWQLNTEPLQAGLYNIELQFSDGTSVIKKFIKH